MEAEAGIGLSKQAPRHAKGPDLRGFHGAPAPLPGRNCRQRDA